MRVAADYYGMTVAVTVRVLSDPHAGSAFRMTDMNPQRGSAGPTPRIAFGLFTVILGIIGWFASFELLTEYVRVLKEPEYNPNCNISVLVTCGPNMGSWQGSLFGFPNAVLGVSAFMAPIIIGVTMIAGVKLPVWFWRIYQLGLFGGIVFIHWLAYQSIFNLGTLCPWCMVVWSVMIPLWWSTLFTHAARGDLGASRGLRRFGESGVQWAWVVITINIILIAAIAQFRLNWLLTEFGIGLM